jgi:rhodanese-related sulfurtransferase
MFTINLIKNSTFLFILNCIVSMNLLFTSCNAQVTNSVKPESFQTLTKDTAYQVLDVRTKSEFDNGYIEKALLANWNDQDEFISRVEHLDKSKTVLIYCLAGSRSHLAAEYLRAKNYKVIELEGGINAWRKQKLPLIGKKSQTSLTLAEFNKIIASNNKVIVDFGAKWCPPCKKTEPIIDSLISNNKSIFILKIDADKDIEILNYFSVNSFPTFYFFNNGIKNSELKGIVTAKQLVEKFN